MSITPSHDEFQTRDAYDAHPTHMAVGPQSPQAVQNITAALATLTDVDYIRVHSPHRRSQGDWPLVFALYDDAETTPTHKSNDDTQPLQKTTIASLSDAVHPLYQAGYQLTVDTTHPGTPKQTTIPRGSVWISQHPLTPHLLAATRQLEDTYQNTDPLFSIHYYWDTDADPTRLYGTHEWVQSSGTLYIILNGQTETVTTAETRLTDAAVSTRPPTYFTSVTHPDTTSESLPDAVTSHIEQKNNSQTLLSLTLEHSDRATNDSQTAIYNCPAERAKTALKDATKTVNKTHSQSSTTEPDTFPSGVQLTVTSPFYLDAIDYEGFSSGAKTDWHDADNMGAGYAVPDDVADRIDLWKQLQNEIFTEVYDITRHGGYCAVNIGNVRTDNGQLISLESHFHAVMQSIGWKLEDKITWHKTTSGTSRYGTTASKQRPTYYYSNQMTETIFIYSRGDPERRDNPRVTLANSDIMTKEIANNVWHIPPEPPNAGINHPAPFPAEIPYRLINLYTYPGDLVYDPLLGSGTTVTVARELNRFALGTERNATFTSTARTRTYATEFERRNLIIPLFSDPSLNDLIQTIRQHPDITSVSDLLANRSYFCTLPSEHEQATMTRINNQTTDDTSSKTAETNKNSSRTTALTDYI